MKTGIKKENVFKREKTTLFCVCWSVHQMLHMFHVDLDSWRRIECMCCVPAYSEVFDSDKYFLRQPNFSLKKIAQETHAEVFQYAESQALYVP